MWYSNVKLSQWDFLIVLTDIGVQFVSTEFENFLLAHEILHTRAALYRPQSNPAEHFNLVLKEGLKADLNEGSSFYSVIMNVLANYRSTQFGVCFYI